MKFLVSLCSALVSFALIFPAFADEEYWVVSSEHAECIRLNAEIYMGQPSDPVVIIVDACPEADLAAALARTTKNTGVTTLGSGDSVLVLTKKELNCLANIEFDANDNGFVKIPKAISCE